METSQSRFAQPLLTGRHWPEAPAALRPIDSMTAAALRPARTLQLNAEEAATFLRIVAVSSLITRHYDIFRWLNGEIQHFLPHEIMISAWGSFAKWSLKFDIVSRLPGVRTAQLARCRIDELVRDCYAQWIDARREPLVRKAADAHAPHLTCRCAVHGALRQMRSLLVHGVRDERGGDESLYILLNSAPLTRWRAEERFISLAQLFIAQIDVAVRKVAALPLDEAKASDGPGNCLHLSRRELEILDWLRQGKMNCDIAAALEISPFTVKNHLQRIFRKIGVSNRTEAAAKYHEALREAVTGAGADPHA